MTSTRAAFTPPPRILLGPGPSGVDPRVLAAMSHAPLGHLDPVFLGLMDEVGQMLREVFATSNPVTQAISGTGTAGMQAALVNLVEPGDRVIVAVAGYFGARMADMVRRAGGQAITVESPWGSPVPAERVEEALRAAGGPVKAIAVVHAETSTGVLQPLEAIAQLAGEHEAMLVVDAVTSLGGVGLGVDAIGIDVCYSATQKCLGAPSGLSPITVSPRAMAKIRARRAPAASFNLDLELLSRYWGRDRNYHHTAPSHSFYALREALRLALEEGLEARVARHRKVHDQLAKGIAGLGLRFLVDEPYRLPVLNAVMVPDGADDKQVRQRLLAEHNIEIGGGLGPLAGRIWRIGLMGYSAREENVARLLTALRIILGGGRMSRQGAR